MSTPADYSGLITGEHKDKPFFVAIVELLCSGFSDEVDLMETVSALFDLDGADHSRLDAIGHWVGLPRTQNVPTIGSVDLEDADYKTLLRAKILANHWDGSWDGYVAVLDGIFVGTGMTMFAVDNQDMSMDIYILGGTPTSLQMALLNGGLLPPKPEGVRINGFFVISGPLFGLSFSTFLIDGLDVGAFIG